MNTDEATRLRAALAWCLMNGAIITAPIGEPDKVEVYVFRTLAGNARYFPAAIPPQIREVIRVAALHAQHLVEGNRS